MPLVDMKDMLAHAYANGYAVGAFDLAELDFLPAVLAAAESARAPVILRVAKPRSQDAVFAWAMAAVEAAGARATVPVAIQFGGGTDADSVRHGVCLGANGVVASALRESLFRHIDRTRAIVDTAHACGVPVEGELAYVSDTDAGDAHASRTIQYATVAEARGFVERTQVDFLVVSAAMVRGRGKSRLDWGRLKELNAALGMPLVIAGEMGLADEHYRRLIMQGAAKISCSVVPDALAGERLRANVRRDRHAPYSALKEGLHEMIVAQIEPRLRAWGSAGRAAEVLDRCRPWTNILHVVVYDTPRLDAQALRALMTEGQRLLSGIPGVRSVHAGSVADEGGRYRHCLLTRLASVAAADAFRRHPAYTGFMDRRLAPVISDRIEGDYHMIDTIPEIAPRASSSAPLCDLVRPSRDGAGHGQGLDGSGVSPTGINRGKCS